MIKNAAHESPIPGAGWSAAHWAHLLIALGFALIYVLGGLAQTRVGDVPTSLDPGQFPARIGEFTVGSAAEMHARAASQPIGFPVRIQSRDGTHDSLVTVRRAFTEFHDLVTRLNGLFFLAVTLLVFAPRVDVVPARDLFWACLLYGLAVMIGGVYSPSGATWPGALLPLIRILSLVILPTLMLHVGLTFPRRAALLDRSRFLMPLVTTTGLALAAWYFLTWIGWLEGNVAWSEVGLPRRLNDLFLAVVFGSGCLGLVLGSRRSDSDREREQVKWVLWGIAMGGAPYVFLHALPEGLTGSSLIPLGAARLFSIVIPVAFSMAVIRHRFLDVDIIIRRSLIYVTLASLMVGIYALIGIFVGRRVQAAWPATGPFVPIVATLASALLFVPTRRAIALLIDRVFFNIRYTHGQALAAFQKRLRGTTDQQEAAAGLARFVSRNLVPVRIAVAIEHDDKVFVHGDWPEDQSVDLDLRGDDLVVATPGQTARPEIEGGDFPRRLRERGFVLAHELAAEGRCVGAIALGEKTTGRSFIGEDLDLLTAVTRETALRVQRMNLEQDFVDEVVARTQMEEMSRFRTQFFAQFAHDLRSPLTSINWGARNLLDGVVGPVTPDQAVYLEGIEASARQLVRLVNNLLEVTRLESGVPDIELGAVDLLEVAGDSIAKIKPTAATGDVEISLTAEGPALMEGDAEKLLEIVDNLLENAIRYSPPGSVVTASVAATDAQVSLSVEDEGPGVDADDLASIFEPYRQGAPSPHSSQQGFGLGLYVVKSWTERMRGTVVAENRAGRGARFTIRFPALRPES